MPLLTGEADTAWRLLGTANSKAALGMTPIAKRSEAAFSKLDVTQPMSASTRFARHDPFSEVTAAEDQHTTVTAELRSGNVHGSMLKSNAVPEIKEMNVGDRAREATKESQRSTPEVHGKPLSSQAVHK